MPSQERPWQQAIIEAATKQGDLSSLFWAIEWEREPQRYQIATLGGRVPVVPLAPDVQDATDAAQVLMFSLREGKLGKWALWLTHKEILDGLGREWFVWPEVKEKIVKPKRIQRKRQKGWRKPDGCVNVTRPGKWGNPFVVKRNGEQWVVVGANGAQRGEYHNEEAANFRAVQLFELVYLQPKLAADPHYLDELIGKDLMCWCAIGDICHGDVYLDYVPQVKQ